MVVFLSHAPSHTYLAARFRAALSLIRSFLASAAIEIHRMSRFRLRAVGGYWPLSGWIIAPDLNQCADLDPGL